MSKSTVKHAMREDYPRAFSTKMDSDVQVFIEDGSMAFCRFSDVVKREGNDGVKYVSAKKTGKFLLDHILRVSKINFDSNIPVHCLCFDNPLLVPLAKSIEQRERRESTLASLERKKIPEIQWNGKDSVISMDRPLPCMERLLAPGSERILEKAFEDLFWLIINNVDVPDGCVFLITGLLRHPKKEKPHTASNGRLPPKDHRRICKKVYAVFKNVDGIFEGRSPSKKKSELFSLGKDIKVKVGESDLSMMYLANVFLGVAPVPEDTFQMLRSLCFPDGDLRTPTVVMRSNDTDMFHVALMSAHFRIENGYTSWREHRARGKGYEAKFDGKVYLDLIEATADGDGNVGTSKELRAIDKKRKRFEPVKDEDDDTKETKEDVSAQKKVDEFVDIDVLWNEIAKSFQKQILNPVLSYLAACKGGGDDYVKPRVPNIVHKTFITAYKTHSAWIGDLIHADLHYERKVESHMQREETTRKIILNGESYARFMLAAVFEKYMKRPNFRAGNLDMKEAVYDQVANAVMLCEPKRNSYWLPSKEDVIRRGCRLWWTMIYHTFGPLNNVTLPREVEMGWSISKEGHLIL